MRFQLKAVNRISILVCIVAFSSCFSLSVDKLVEVNEEEDWLFIGGNLSKTNISKSKSSLTPPFSLLWEFDADGGLAKNCLSASDAILFANTLNGESYAIDISTGKSLGRTSTIGKASYSTPLIFNNNLIIASSGDNTCRIFSYSLVQGIEKWKKNIGSVESSPVISGENVFACSVNGKIYKMNVRTGNFIWTTSPKYEHLRGSFYTSPTIYSNLILAGSSDGYMYAFDTTFGKEIWKFKTHGSIYADASANEGRIYFGSDDKFFYSLDTTGNLIWEKNINSKFVSSPTFYKDMVIIPAVDGNVYALDKDSGNVRWKFTTKGAIWASPLLHKNMIFIGSFDRNFYCISADDGKELWHFPCEGRVRTSAVIWKDYIFTASDDKYIYCFTNEGLVKNSSGNNIK